MRQAHGRVRPLGYDRLPSADEPTTTGLPARSYMRCVEPRARREGGAAVWDAAAWLSPAQRERVSEYARRPASMRRCFFELQGDGGLALWAGESPTDASAVRLYVLALADAPLRWPALPALSLSHDGVLALHALELCIGACEGGRQQANAPPAGVDALRVVWRVDLSAAGRFSALDDPRAHAGCARHVLLARAEDAMLALYCNDEVAPRDSGSPLYVS
mgnify:CR=1 FL=1